jgi:predicted RND superfamily exporter protein
MHVALDTGRPDGIKDPEFLQALGRAQERIDAINGVGGTASLVQVVRKMNATMNVRDPRYAIPDDGRVIAYYLLLVEGRSYDSLWGGSFGKARLTVFCRRGDYITSRRVVPEVERIVREELPGVALRLGGDFVLGRRWLSLVGRDQARSLASSLALVFLVAALGLRSLRKALVVAAPIAFAVALKFGFLGQAGIPLSVASSTFSAIILGIGVDYAIHLQSRYDLLRRSGSRRTAVGGAFATAGEAVFWDVAVVMAGFLTLIASRMPPTQELGIMVTLGVAAAVLSTFLILPALLGAGEAELPLGGDSF